MDGLTAPSLFLAHGAPTLALDRGPWSRAVRAAGARLAGARGVVVVSAHWEAPEARVGGAERPATVHDFGGFSPELYRLRYPAPGDPALAGRCAALLAQAGVRTAIDASRGLDHGAWVPLLHLFPAADVPVVPVALPLYRTSDDALALGRALAPLRDDGVVVLGTGGVVHNLATVRFDAPEGAAAPWAAEFDAWCAEQVARGDEAALAAWRLRAPHADWAAPSAEHLDPLLVAVGAARGERAEPVFEGFQLGTLSLRSWAFGLPTA